jgi:hypothetical protein
MFSGSFTDFDPLPAILKELDLPRRSEGPFHDLQLRYVRIDRDDSGHASFTASGYGEGGCFYPASTVKLPLVLATLEKLNRSGLAGLQDLLLSVAGYPGAATIAACIGKIFLVSDNDAANRLFEFVGRRELNRVLRERGYTQTRILHRFGARGTATDQAATPEVCFHRQGRLLYRQPARKEEPPAGERHGKSPDLSGDGRMDNLAGKNRTSLAELLEMIRSVMFPASMDPSRRFLLTGEDLAFLASVMCRLPAESDDPVYDGDLFAAGYAKFLLPGEDDDPAPSGVRIFSKSGWARGFLTDAAYIADSRNNVEYMLAATLRVDDDGSGGEDHYRYGEGKRLLGRLSRLIYRHELERPRKYPPDLSRYIYSFDGQDKK